jgi:hypothetical protein
LVLLLYCYLSVVTVYKDSIDRSIQEWVVQTSSVFCETFLDWLPVFNCFQYSTTPRQATTSLQNCSQRPIRQISQSRLHSATNWSAQDCPVVEELSEPTLLPPLTSYPQALGRRCTQTWNSSTRTQANHGQLLKHDGHPNHPLLLDLRHEYFLQRPPRPRLPPLHPQTLPRKSNPSCTTSRTTPTQA